MTEGAAQAQELDRLIRSIRRCFQALKALGDQLHADIGVTAAMRAVLEFLYDHGPETVPNIARAKTVSRQHIQQLADALAAQGFIDALPNPAHKSSPLIALSDKGRKCFVAMRKREKSVLMECAVRLEQIDLSNANTALALLHATVSERLQLPIKD